MKSKSLGGTIVAHRVVERDYCFRESLTSLCAVCDEVIVVTTPDSEGEIYRIAASIPPHPKLRIIVEDWNPCRHGFWLSDLTNQARRQLSTKFHLSLQADEVLNEAEYVKIRDDCSEEVTMFTQRLNFWVRPTEVLPPGVICGSNIIRIGNTFQHSCVDAENLAPLPESSHAQTTFKIYHYGHIRKAKGFVIKSRELQTAHLGVCDPIIDRIEAEGIGACEGFRGIKALPFVNKHPKIMHGWLKERFPNWKP
jgi:hypothetical protein